MFELQSEGGGGRLNLGISVEDHCCGKSFVVVIVMEGNEISPGDVEEANATKVTRTRFGSLGERGEGFSADPPALSVYLWSTTLPVSKVSRQ